MSKRDSRVHIAVRQNDTLLEFENFKKKFLFANKQITKQNCSLSLKIEELNAHISSLYVENLRLRASEIALQSQLKREREKCQKIMADAEAATMSLLKHFGIIRESYNVPVSGPPSSKDSDSPPPSTRKGPPPRSPSAPRLALQPSVPDIAEDPEEYRETSSEENAHLVHLLTENNVPSTISRKPRKSASRLPVPARVASPPPPTNTSLNTLLGETNSQRKKKLSRRTSGLMVIQTDLPPRPTSPAYASPFQDDSEPTDIDEYEAKHEECEVTDAKASRRGEVHKKVKKEKRTKVKEDSESDVFPERKERKKPKDSDPVQAVKLKDVTNSPRRRRAPPLSTESTSEIDNGRTSSDMSEVTNFAPSNVTYRQEDGTYLPTPLPSNTSTPVTQHATLPTHGIENITGRERRSRKSVNYAEPKLNTKMRKPDVILPLAARHSLPATSACVVTPMPPSHSSQPRSSGESARDDEPPEDGVVRRTSSSTSLSKRKRSAKSIGEGASDEDGDDDGGADADAEFSDFKGNWTGVSSRRKSSQNNADTGRRKLESTEARRHSIAI